MNKQSNFRVNWREANEKAKEKPHIKLLLNAMKNNFNPPPKDTDPNEDVGTLCIGKKDSANCRGNGSMASDILKTETMKERCEKKLSDENGVSKDQSQLFDSEKQSPSLASVTAGGVNESRDEQHSIKNMQGTENVSHKASSSASSEPASPLKEVSPGESEGEKNTRLSRKRPLRHRIYLRESFETDNSIVCPKRSVRRWSKEGESVLQNAIARKEKSLSSIGHSEEEKVSKSGVVKSLRERRHSLPTRKYMTGKSVEKNLPSTSESSPDSKCKLVPSKSPLIINCDASKTEPGAESPSIKSESSSKSASMKGDSDFVPYSYTKTGKRRYKPFRGLRYSFTSTTKRTKMIRRSRPHESSTNKERLFKAQSANASCSAQKRDGKAESASSVEACRSNSPAIAEACTSKARKSRREFSSAPSPSPADTAVDASQPESTAISYGAGTAGICLCQSKSNFYVRKESLEDPDGLVCQAIDSLEGRLIGCCNSVEGTEFARFYRASCRVPFTVLCEQHKQRLLRHNCCPGCGHFCTQGRFVQCSSLHHYHRDCQLTKGEKAQCPHCGVDSPPDEVTISVGQHKHPVFLPHQKLVKKLPSARMCVVGSSTEDADPLKPPSLLSPSFEIPSVAHILDKGDREKLEQLLNGASSVRSEGRTAHLQRFTTKHMYHAAKAGDAEKLIQILKYGLNPSHVFREIAMRTALHAAASKGHTLVVHVLVQAGAQLDPQDSDLMTPMMLAALNGHSRVIQYLVKAGACVTLQGSDGMNALHIAAKRGDLNSCHIILSGCKLPLNYINMKDDGGWTALVWSSEFRHFEVARYLLEKKADPSIRDMEGNIALHWAALSGSEEISESLLNCGCDVNSLNNHGDSPLHVASRQNNLACVILFLARGAKLNFVNKLGQQVIDCAKEGGECHHILRTTSELRKTTDSCKERTIRILTNDVTHGKEEFEIQCLNAVDEENEPQNYVYVTDNCFTSNISVDRTVTSMQSCECEDNCIGSNCKCTQLSLQSWYDSDGKLLPDFNFFDPPMLFECNVLCACNTKLCKNRVVQWGPKLRFQLFRTVGKGWGVRTLTQIPKGTYVCEYIGEIISDCEADQREDDSYLFDLDNRDGETYCIDACRYGNIARFINHMCAPNLQPIRVFIGHHDLHFPRIAFFANRDIMAHEELGFDYGDKFWIIKCKSFCCTCGAPNCKYSESTIQKTLADYKRKQALENAS